MNILEIIGNFSNIAGAVSGIAAALGVLKLLAANRRQEQPIVVSLVLQDGGESVVLPLRMRRRDVTRAELLGRLGMFTKGGGRFSLAALSDPETLDGINYVVEGKSSSLVLPCSPEELEQFAL